MSKDLLSQVIIALVNEHAAAKDYGVSLVTIPDFDYAKTSMERTHRWLDRCLTRFNETEPKYGYHQALFPIVQGCVYPDLRRRSAEFIASKGAGGNAIGAVLRNAILNGDIVSDVNIKAMIEYGVKSSLPVIMFVTQMQSPYGIVEMNGDRLVSFKEKPILEDYYINGGIYFTKSKIDFGEFKTGDIEKIYFPTIAKENNLGYFKENGIFWIAVDTYKELEAVKKEYENKTDKPWGYEKILILTEMYSTKELYIKEGFRTSLHYHIEKDETMYILSGSGYIEFEDKKEYFSKNDSIRIQPGVVHSIVATENTLLHEVSTPYLEDTVCIEDYYVR